MQKIQLRWFRIKIATSRVYANFQLGWRPAMGRSHVAVNSINYCSSDLKILLGIVLSTNKRSSELKKYPLNPSAAKNFRNGLSYFARYRQLFITFHSAVSCVANLDFSIMFLHKSAHLANCEIILQISKLCKFRKIGFFCISPRIGAFGDV